jgi:hypothetical protein
LYKKHKNVTRRPVEIPICNEKVSACKITPKFSILELQQVAGMLKAKVTTLTYKRYPQLQYLFKVGCPACCLKTRCGPADFRVWVT